MGIINSYEDRKEYQRIWQRKYVRGKYIEKRRENFMRLLEDIMAYEMQGLTYSEIAVKLTNDYKYRLTIKENNYGK